jgi:hypothetical protein
MEVNPGVFTSNLSAEEWEPDTDPPEGGTRAVQWRRR